MLTPADEEFHINKHDFKVPFVCGCRDLGEALRRIGEGAAMIRTKGEAGTGNVVEAVRHLRAVTGAHPPPPGDARRGADDRGQEAAGARTSWSSQVARDRQAAGPELQRGRRRHAGRRGADDAARRGGGLRRLRHLQVERSEARGRRRSWTRWRTTTIPSSWPRSRRGWASRCPAWMSRQIAEKELLAPRGW